MASHSTSQLVSQLAYLLSLYIYYCGYVCLPLWGFPAVLLILYIQISSLCTSGPRMRERTAVIFPDHGWLARQPSNPSEHGTIAPMPLQHTYIHQAICIYIYIYMEGVRIGGLSSCLWSAYPQISDTWMCSPSDWPSGWLTDCWATRAVILATFPSQII